MSRASPVACSMSFSAPVVLVPYTLALEALDDAARHFDQAYDAAAKRYEEF